MKQLIIILLISFSSFAQEEFNEIKRIYDYGIESLDYICEKDGDEILSCYNEHFNVLIHIQRSEICIYQSVSKKKFRRIKKHLKTFGKINTSTDPDTKEKTHTVETDIGYWNVVELEKVLLITLEPK